jgi:hypothetical protein
MNLKKLERYLRVDLLGPGPWSYKKIVYRAAVSQRLGNTGLVVRMLTSGALDREFEPDRRPSDFSGVKILSMPSFWGEVKPSFPCRSFAACKRTQQFRGSRIDWTDGFTSSPKDFFVRKIRRRWPGLNPQFWVPEASVQRLDHRSRLLKC